MSGYPQYQRERKCTAIKTLLFVEHNEPLLLIFWVFLCKFLWQPILIIILFKWFHDNWARCPWREKKGTKGFREDALQVKF